MNDVERDLHELFERKASSVGGVAPRLPETVRKRGRRRQLGTAFVSGLTALAVLAGTVGVLRAVDTGGRQPTPADDPWAGYEVFERTATIDPFTITSQSDWYLVRLHEHLCGSTKSCDLLQLTNFDPGLESSVCDGDALPAGGVALMVSVVPELRLSRLPSWPTTIESPNGDGRCGEGRYFLFQDDMDVTPYQAWIGSGVDADAQAVAQLLRSFQGMTVATGTTPGRTTSLALTTDAAYVIAGGENAAGPWRLELSESTSGTAVLFLVSPEGGVTTGIPDEIPSSEPIWQKGGDPVFGAVTKEAVTVELHTEEGTPPIPTQIVPLPPSLPFNFDLFFASHEGDEPAQAVAIDDEGAEIGASQIDARADLTTRGNYVVTRFAAFGRRWELHASPRQDRCTYLVERGSPGFGGGCGDTMGESSVVPPYAFVWGMLKDDAITAEIVADDGRRFPAIAVGSAPNGRRYFALAMEGHGPGTLRMLDADGSVVYRQPEVTWPDNGQVINER